MRNHDLWVEDPTCLPPTSLLCTIDPLSAMVGGLIPGLMGGGKSEAPPAPQAPPPQAPPAQKPTPKQGSTSTGSFIGGVPTPPPSSGGKTLLGQ